jgi:hypothetical protein
MADEIVTSLINQIAGELKEFNKADYRWATVVEAEDAIADAGIPVQAVEMQLIGLVATGNVRALDGNGELIDIEECTAIELEDKLRSVCLDDLLYWFRECLPKQDHITIAPGDFSGVANCITEQPPKWLPIALAYYAKWLPGTKDNVDIPNIVDRLQRAVEDMEKWLPTWEYMGYDVKCPPDIKTILSALPGLKKELDRLNHRHPADGNVHRRLNLNLNPAEASFRWR